MTEYYYAKDPTTLSDEELDRQIEDLWSYYEFYCDEERGAIFREIEICTEEQEGRVR